MASVGKPSLMSLQSAVDDPLGTNLKRRGMDAYYEEAHKSDPNYMSGPLPDPQWEGMGQALTDAHVTKVGMDAGRPRGIADDPTQPGWAEAPVDLNTLSGDELQNTRRMQSTNIAGAQPRSMATLSLEGLSDAAKAIQAKRYKGWASLQ